MTENIGQIITRYTICQITCNAYTRAMHPANSQSSFRKTGIFPHNPSVISMQQLVPCESFRVENPVQRVKLLKTERADCTTKDWNQAQCRGKSYNWRRLRQRNGRLYTKQSNVSIHRQGPRCQRNQANFPNKRTGLNHLPAASMSFIWPISPVKKRTKMRNWGKDRHVACAKKQFTSDVIKFAHAEDS